MKLAILIGAAVPAIALVLLAQREGHLPHGKDECDAVQIDLVEVITGKPKPKKRRTNGI